jgi:hypothetical protein
LRITASEFWKDPQNFGLTARADLFPWARMLEQNWQPSNAFACGTEKKSLAGYAPNRRAPSSRGQVILPQTRVGVPVVQRSRSVTRDHKSQSLFFGLQLGLLIQIVGSAVLRQSWSREVSDENGDVFDPRAWALHSSGRGRHERNADLPSWFNSVARSEGLSNARRRSSPELASEPSTDLR